MTDILLTITALTLPLFFYAIGLFFIHRADHRARAEDRAFWASVDSGRAEALRIWRDLPEGAFKDGMLLGIKGSIAVERKREKGNG